jgi:hypothetical protein
VIIPLQEFELTPGSYEHLSESVRPEDAVLVSVVSTDAVGVFFVDRENFHSFQKGQTYRFYGLSRALRFNQSFSPPYAATWHLVVQNRTERIATVRLRAALRRALQRA